MKLQTILCAKGVAVDARSNAISVFGILDEISPASIPTSIHEVTVLCILRREADDRESTKLHLCVRFNDAEILRSLLEVSFKDKRTVRTIYELHGLPLKSDGDLIFVIYDEAGKELGSYAVLVKGPKTGFQREFLFQKARAADRTQGSLRLP